MGSLQIWCNMDTSWRCCPREGCLIWWNAWLSNLASVLKRKDEKWWRALQINGGFHILTLIYYLEMVETCSETTWTLCSIKKSQTYTVSPWERSNEWFSHLDTRSTKLKTHYISKLHKPASYIIMVYSSPYSPVFAPFPCTLKHKYHFFLHIINVTGLRKVS